MALLIALIMLLLLTMIGLSSMQNSTLQEKMAASVMARNQSFQLAEAVLRVGENIVSPAAYTLASCGTASASTCAPPPDSNSISSAGTGSNGVAWVASGTGFYAIQKLGTTANAVNAPSGCSASVTLFRITAVGIVNGNRSVVESIYAKC
jgi:type IV pilus assembly protein PilX